jgi:hypothetical protein
MKPDELGQSAGGTSSARVMVLTMPVFLIGLIFVPLTISLMIAASEAERAQILMGVTRAGR